MKHLNKLFAGALMLAGFAANAQDSTNPWAVSFGVNAVDTKVSMTVPQNDKLLFEELYNPQGNWNIVPSVSYVNVARNVGGNFSFGLTGSFNKISKWVNLNNQEGTKATHKHDVVNPGDLNYYGVDGAITYSFKSLLKSKWFDPSLHLGGGYTFFGDASAGTVNGGWGLNLWFAKNVALTLGSTLKYGFDDSRAANVDVPTHIFHQAGLKFQFGAKDRDDDGIIDAEDACPDVKGIAAFQGCPDTDGDGIQDSADSCPEEPGTPEMNGCPDQDGDGVADKDDACIDVPGLPVLKGCPDADGDGVADQNDKCPNVAGPKDNAGCPWPDTDGDKVLDKDDKCPTVAGTVANNGCPEVSDETMKKLNDYAKTILFNSGKFSFQKQTFPVLEAITAILKEYPTAKFSIEGHTDNVGKADFNQKLSDGRANAVKQYLIDNGIDPFRLTSKGFGESMPIDTNKTAKGKANNRRVEVKLVK